MKTNFQRRPEGVAQVHTADRAGTGDFELVAALATAPGGEFLVCAARGAGCRGDLRGAATALVPGLVSALVTAGILFQPIHRTLRSGGIFCIHHYAAGIMLRLAGKDALQLKRPHNARLTGISPRITAHWTGCSEETIFKSASIHWFS